jgi:hypothetical protein
VRDGGDGLSRQGAEPTGGAFMGLRFVKSGDNMASRETSLLTYLLQA